MLRSFKIALTLGVLLIGYQQSSAYAQKEAKKGKEKEKDPTSAEAATDQIRICKIDVFYNWQPEKSLNVPDADATYRRYYGTIMDQGVEEEEVRLRLLGRVSSVSTEAMTACSELHQEKSSCIVTRLREISKKFARYDFPRRRLLTEASERDCHTAAGHCDSVAVGEIECWGNASPDSPSLADFAPVTVATSIEDEDSAVTVDVTAVDSKASKQGEVVEVKRKQVLKAAAPTIKAPEVKEETPPANENFNSPFVVD